MSSRLEFLDEVDSTNEEARRRAEAGEPGPLWIAAHRQTAGRGRRARAWFGGEGNLHATLLFRPEMTARDGALLSFAACLAVADLFQTYAPEADVALKWPNDPLLNGKKAAGVLLESSGRGARLDWIAVGIGINLAHAPESVEPGGWPATSIAAETGRPAPDLIDALTLLASAFAGWRAQLANHGFGPIRDAWIARAARLGERIEARLPNETVAGVFEDVDWDGALVLRTPSGPRLIQAADVYFRESIR